MFWFVWMKNAKMSRVPFWHQLATVRKKRVQEALQAIKDGFQEANKPISKGMIDFATKALKSRPFVELLLEQPEQLFMASAMAGLLWAAGNDNSPEEEWKQRLQRTKKEFPYMLRSALLPEIKKHVKDLPKRSSTGRRRLLAVNERKKACDLVSKYNRDGDSFRTAYERAAAELNCSARTVQRAWTQRSKKRKPDQPQTASPNS